MTVALGSGRRSSVAAALPPHVVMCSFVQETILMDVRTAEYFSLDRLGGAMLRRVLGSGSLAAAAETLVADGSGDFETTAAELDELCEELAALGLLEIAGPG